MRNEDNSSKSPSGKSSGAQGSQPRARDEEGRFTSSGGAKASKSSDSEASGRKSSDSDSKGSSKR